MTSSQILAISGILTGDRARTRDGDQPRRTAYRQLVALGALPGGYATEDGVGLHYVAGVLHEAVSVLPDARAWKVDPDGSGGFRETEIVPRYLESL